MPTPRDPVDKETSKQTPRVNLLRSFAHGVITLLGPSELFERLYRDLNEEAKHLFKDPLFDFSNTPEPNPRDKGLFLR